MIGDGELDALAFNCYDENEWGRGTHAADVMRAYRLGYREAEFHSATPARADGLAPGCMRVRIAVSVDHRRQWVATGWNHADGTQASDEDMRRSSIDTLEEGERTSIVVAEVPFPQLPAIAEVIGSTEPAP